MTLVLVISIIMKIINNNKNNNKSKTNKDYKKWPLKSYNYTMEGMDKKFI